MKTWPSLLLACCLQGILSFSVTAQEIAQTFTISALDQGYYDAYGERDPREREALAGRRGYEAGRSPLRGFFAFDIPYIPGTITNVYLRLAQYSSSQAETVHLHQISSPMHLVRNGGFGLTNIYSDLGDGLLYSSTNVRAGFFFGLNLSLTPDAIAAIQAAQGQTFGLGLTLATLDSQSTFDELLRIAWSELVIEATVPQRPAFYQEPTRLFSWSGVPYTAAASGSPPITYQWYLNNMPYGQPATWPTINLGLSSNSQPVYVVASNAFGMTTSSVIHASLPAASFQLLLTNLTVRAGDDVYLNNGAVTFHAGPPRALWFKDGVPWDNAPWYGIATNATLHLQDAQLSDTGDYSIVASNSLGMATSAVVRIQVVETPPVFWTQPRGSTSAIGQDFLLYAVVKSSPPAAFHWFHNGTPVSSTNGTTLQVFTPGLSASGDYYLVASNIMGSTTSHVAHIQIYSAPPVFNLQPADLTGYAGARLTASVSVSGTPQPQLRWYINDALFHTGYNSDLFIEPASASHAGSLYCVAENASGITTSRVATISVLQVPPILQPLPPIVNVLAGSTEYLRVSVENWETPHHIQWQFNGQDLAGANAADLVLLSMSATMAGNYRVIVTNAFGATTSSVVAVSVQTQPPAFPWQPLGVTVLEGQTININVTAIGAPPPRLFLLRDGQPISAVSNPNGFTIPGATLRDAGNYQVLASNLVGTTISDPFRVNVQQAGPLDRWTQRNPLPQGQDLHSLAVGNGVLVAVGDYGAIIRSTDGIHWTSHSFRTAANLNAVTYANGRFIAVGDNGTILASTNGAAWSVAFQGDLYEALRSVTFGNGYYLATGERPEGPIAYVSTNGSHWHPHVIPAAFQFAFGGGSFVGVDSYALAAYRSPDLNSWVPSVTGMTSAGHDGVSFVNGRFFVTARSGIYAYSADGATWTSLTNAATARRIYAVTYGANRYVTVGARGEITFSPDAINWSAVLPTPTIDRLEDVRFENNLFVAVGENGTIITSPTGLPGTWTVRTVGTTADLDGIASANGVAVAVGKGGTILTSANGRDWTARTAPVLGDWYGVAYAQGKWVVVGQSTNILTSSNAIDWVAHSYIANDYYLKGITYANNTWIAVGIRGVIVTSPDGINWTQRPSGVTADLNQVTYGNNLFVVVGDGISDQNATILVSGLATEWVNRSFAVGKNTRTVKFANGTFAIGANDGLIYYGSDPLSIAWTQAFVPAGHDGLNLRGIAATNSFWIAVANQGYLFTSTNAHAWKQRITPTFENLHAAAYLNNTWIVVGNNGTILQSLPLESQLLAERRGTNIVLTLTSPHDRVFKLQSTDNFTWTDHALITNEVGTVDYLLPISPGPTQKFFRIIEP